VRGNASAFDGEYACAPAHVGQIDPTTPTLKTLDFNHTMAIVSTWSRLRPEKVGRVRMKIRDGTIEERARTGELRAQIRCVIDAPVCVADAPVAVIAQIEEAWGSGTTGVTVERVK